jgi:putative OPT family oligopeptide transporter
VSFRAIALGCVLGVIFAGAATYVGHKVGIIDGGNIPATIIAFGVLSALLGRRPTTDEGNIVQTISSSSAMMTITGGLIGPIAALVLAGEKPNLWLVVPWGMAIGVFGCYLAVPLRAAFIVRGSLPFPSGLATAEVLESVYSGKKSARRHLAMLAIGGGFAFLFAFGRALAGLPEMWLLPLTIGAFPAASMYVGLGYSPLLLGTGYLAGPRAGLSLALGAVIAWLVIAPQLVAAKIVELDFMACFNWLLFVGTGLMIGGTFGPIIGALRGMRSGMREVLQSDDFRIERGYIVRLVLAAGAVIVLGTIAFDVSPLIPVMALVLAILFAAAAARANGETDNTPAGPLGGFAQLVIGSVSPGRLDVTLSGGGAVSGSLMHSANMLQNWKTGILVNTPPRTQFIAQLIGVVVGALACAGAFELIVRAYGLGTEAVPAPVAASWKATAEVVRHGISTMPAYAPLGAAIGLVVGVVLALKPVAKYAPSPVALGLAFMIPPYVSLTIAVGGGVYWLVARRSQTAADEAVPLGASLIAGEAIAGLVIAALIVSGVTIPLF